MCSGFPKSWQSAHWVFGVEGQGNWADFSGSNTAPIGGNPLGGASDRTRIDAFGLITGQVGYAWNNVLAYVKGGAAVVDDNMSIFAVTGAALRQAAKPAGAARSAPVSSSASRRTGRSASNTTTSSWTTATSRWRRSAAA